MKLFKKHYKKLVKCAQLSFFQIHLKKAHQLSHRPLFGAVFVEQRPCYGHFISLSISVSVCSRTHNRQWMRKRPPSSTKSYWPVFRGFCSKSLCKLSTKFLKNPCDLAIEHFHYQKQLKKPPERWKNNVSGNWFWSLEWKKDKRQKSCPDNNASTPTTIKVQLFS